MIKFAIRALYYFISHLKYVATVPREVKRFELFKCYKRYNFNIISYVTKMKHLMSFKQKDINTVIILLKCPHLTTHMH